MHEKQVEGSILYIQNYNMYSYMKSWKDKIIKKPESTAWDKMMREKSIVWGEDFQAVIQMKSKVESESENHPVLSDCLSPHGLYTVQWNSQTRILKSGRS